MYDVVIRWKNDRLSDSVLSNVELLSDAIRLANETAFNTVNGLPHFINIFENYRCIASLRIMR